MPRSPRTDDILQRVRRELAQAPPIVARGRAPRRPTAAVTTHAPNWPLRALGIAAGLAVGAAVGLTLVRHGKPSPAPASPAVAATVPSASSEATAPQGAEPGAMQGPTRRDPERFTVDVINTRKTVEVVLGGLAGEPDEESYKALRHELRSSSGAEAPLDPRLIELLHQIAKRGGGTVQVLSAFRPPKSSQDHNYHTRGMAADVRVAGMKTTELRDLARKLGAAGVGYYPTSQFVHIDVREGHYEWTDTSGPGQNNDEPGPAAGGQQVADTPKPPAPPSPPADTAKPPATPEIATVAVSGTQQAQQTAQPQPARLE
jgi:uncharacterized protein YcbK (DUF882 family)